MSLVASEDVDAVYGYCHEILCPSRDPASTRQQEFMADELQYTGQAQASMRTHYSSYRETKKEPNPTALDFVKYTLYLANLLSPLVNIVYCRDNQRILRQPSEYRKPHDCTL